MLKKNGVLILGGCGYLGSALSSYLLKNSYNVASVDLEWYGNFSSAKNLKKDYSLLTSQFFSEFQTIVLLAGYSTVSMCEQQPLSAFKNNVTNFINLIKKLSNQKFIYASSYRVYKYTSEKKVSEKYKIFSYDTVYDTTKNLLDEFSNLSKLNFYGLRMGSVNGYSPNFRKNQIINKLFLDALHHNRIEAFNPESTFSVLGINDFCRAVESLIQFKGTPGIYNLASFDTQIRNIGSLIRKRFETVKIHYQSKNGSRTCKISSLKFRKEFNFKFYDTPEKILDELSINFTKKTHILDDTSPVKY